MLAAGIMGGVVDVGVVSSFVVTFLAVVAGLAVVVCPAVDDAADVAFVAIGLVVAGTGIVVCSAKKINKWELTIIKMDLLFFR